MPRKLLNPSAGTTIVDTLNIYNGGTGANTAPQALVNLDGVLPNTVNQPLGPVELDAAGNLPAGVSIPVSGSVTLEGPGTVSALTSNEYVITNYNTWTNYIVSVDAGNVSMAGDIVTFFAPSGTGNVTLDINGSLFNILVENNVLLSPVITTPPNGTIDVGPTLNVTSSNIGLQATSQIAKLLASDGAAGDNFGWSVAVAADGNTAVIGSPIDNTAVGTGAGSLYVYKFDGFTWVETKLTASDGGNNDYLGYTVSINDAGTIIVAGAYLHDGIGLNSGAVYVYTFNGSVWLQTKLTASDEAADDFFGYSVAINSNGTTIVAGAIQNDDNGISSGSAYIFNYNGTNWVETKILASDGLLGDQYGASVGVSGDGLTVSVGARYSDSLGANSGSVYIYKYNGATWVETKIVASDGAAEDFFGYATSISTDGSTMVVGAYQDDDQGLDSGSIYVYKYNGTNWIETKLLADDGTTLDYYGTSLDVNNDGTLLIVGALTDDDLGIDSGSAYTYKYNGVAWVGSKILASDGAANDFFGRSVSVNNDGTRVIVGSYQDDDNGTDSGSAYVFNPIYHLSTQYQVASDANFTNILQDDIVPATTNHTLTGLVVNTTYYVRLRYISVNYGTSSWSNVVQFTTANSFIPSNELAKLLASDGAATDYFGNSVSVSSDGLTVVVGSYFDDTTNGVNSGSMYIYKYNGTSWIETKLLASDGAANDNFGYSIAISDDGLTVVVGAIGNDTTNGTDSGSIYIYKYNGTSWIETKLLASDGAASDNFGYSIAVNSDGLTVVVGSYFDDTTNGVDSGSIYIYKYNGTSWIETKIIASDGAATDYFGRSVSVSSDGLTVVVGAYGDTTNGTNSGSAYIYKYNATTWVETKIIASDGAANDQFGQSVSISSDGLTVVVGAILDTNTNAAQSGSAYIYKYNATTWVETKIIASDGAVSDRFGNSVSVSSDGLTVVVGAYSDDTTNGTNSGSTYIYRFNGTTWVETKLLASDGAANDNFGNPVSISSDGLTVVVGSYFDDTANGTDSGSAYIFGP